jgi:riboflavin biosynthesis pyrimidine reductase
VEAGPTIAAAFIDADLADEVVIGRGTQPLGAAGRKPFVNRGLELLDDRSRWQCVTDRKLSGDRLTVHRRTNRFGTLHTS